MTRFLLPLAAALLGLAACSSPGEDAWHGYVEGDFVEIAPDAPGRIVEVSVREGASVEAGAPLFALDDTAERAALAAAEAQLETALARFDDAAAGARDPEIAAARDQLRQAQAQLAEAEAAHDRAAQLFESGYVSQARLDDAEAAVETARARVSELSERLTLVQLGPRENELRALQGQIAAARAEIERAGLALDRRRVAAPSDARVHRQIRFAGEQAGPAQPVVSLLPDGAVHAIVFVPEPAYGAVGAGTRLSVSCDGCAEGLAVELVTLAEEAEFTPPVIYSDTERERLVYRAEARFLGDTAPPPGTPLALRPGP